MKLMTNMMANGSKKNTLSHNTVGDANQNPLNS
jgi:hypothetical protein